VARESKLYQDQLYGTKVLSPLAVAILDTPEFQRLTSLKQLGFTCVVYRGAHHTRLAHSVGTYFVCRTMMRRIAQNHERIDLSHPALLQPALSPRLTYNPSNAGLDEKHTSAQATWRGLTEVISAAGLLHDIGHVPFGHTLEDEFTGIYRRHDSLGSPRVYTMLFDDQSALARIFSDDATPSRWLPQLSNRELGRLIYLILSWKDKIEPPKSFAAILEKELKGSLTEQRRAALELLKSSFAEFTERGLFQPYMSDIVGNTICADLLDYLPRDRMNLGMEAHRHQRLQRYVTIRPGTHREGEGLRISIMVTRRGRGGQRRDVATSILDIMRQRYEMAERVYYHHKKAAASAMLVKLFELLPVTARPRDDDAIYPAPWTTDVPEIQVPHLVHLSDAEFISYLGNAQVPKENRRLQAQLYDAIRYRRDLYYRTLLVLDVPLADSTVHPVSYFTTELREPEDREPNAGRLALEEKLATAGGATIGEVIVYCPPQHMQAKEVDVRAEIQEDRVLPLRIQESEFTYHADLEVLAQYYQELWRTYVFVSPQLFLDPVRCKAIVDALCTHFDIDPAQAYRKVRGHRFMVSEIEAVRASLEAVGELLSGLSFDNLPKHITSALMNEAATDQQLLVLARASASPADCRGRLESLLEVVTLEHLITERRVSASAERKIRTYQDDLRGTGKRFAVAAREGGGISSFDAYSTDLLNHFVSTK